jgi:predicted TIM-barrel fold metal-dependent hydrolase
MWAPVVPSREIIDHVTNNFPAEQIPYLEVFSKRRVTPVGWSAYAASLAKSDDAILDELDQAGIRMSMVTGFDEATSCGVTFVANDAVASLVERHPDRFIPFCGADVLAGTGGVRSARRWITDHGFKGLSLRPFMIGEPASHRAYWPFYELCCELGAPLSIHTSVNWTRSQPSDLGHPRHLDEVACAFPDLTIIASHAGYPWVLEACLLAWKHPNLYLELGAHRPKYFTSPGAGWEPLLRFGKTTIRHKILYGTGAFLIGRPYALLADEIRSLPVDDDVLEHWLWRNATQLLGLSE